MLQIIIPVLIGAVIAAIIAGFIAHSAGRSYERKQYDSKVGSAEEKAREIIDEALKTAETKKREALLEAKEESLKTKNELEKETKERRAELQRYEKRVLSKEENVEKKADALEKKEADLVRRENILGERTAEVETQYEQGIQELERISGLTSEQAKEYLLKSVEEDVKHDTAKLIKELENKAKEEADKKARNLVVTAIQRCAADHVAETNRRDGRKSAERSGEQYEGRGRSCLPRSWYPWHPSRTGKTVRTDEVQNKLWSECIKAFDRSSTVIRAFSF